MQNLFQKATKQAAKLRLALSGPSGSGKTFTALQIAKHLGGKVAFIDTEHGSASKYADLFDFDVVNFDAPYHPDRYGNLLKMAEGAGYDIAIIDSLSHAWNGKGGLLEIVDEEMVRLKTKNSMPAWKKATPIHNALIENILASKLHVIATMRSKQEYLVEKDDKGKTQISKVGLAPIQRDGMEYEFDVWGEMDLENRMSISKTRCTSLTGKVIHRPGKEVAETLTNWLKGAAPLQAGTNGATQEPVTMTVCYSEKERAKFHAIGNALYGSNWDSKYKELIKHITEGRTESMKELNRPEFDKLIQNLEYKQSQGTAEESMTPGDQSEALYAGKAA